MVPAAIELPQRKPLALGPGLRDDTRPPTPLVSSLDTSDVQSRDVCPRLRILLHLPMCFRFPFGFVVDELNGT